MHAVFADSAPTLPQLLSFPTSSGANLNLLQEIGVKYSDFGIFLLDDRTGQKMENIVEKCHKDPVAINHEVFRLWLIGNGRSKYPVTWSTLVTVLETIGLMKLAKEIQSKFRNESWNCI